MRYIIIFCPSRGEVGFELVEDSTDEEAAGVAVQLVAEAQGFAPERALETVIEEEEVKIVNLSTGEQLDIPATAEVRYTGFEVIL